jgi:hypothetical protein
VADNPRRHTRDEYEPDVYRDWGASPLSAEARRAQADDPSELPEDQEAVEDYAAHNLAQERLAIEFYHADGMITVEFYRHLQTVVCPPPYRLLSLMYMSGVYILEGRDLHQLIPRISRHRLGELYCFDPNRFALPDKGPVVFAITRKSLDEIGAELADSQSREDGGENAAY